MIRILGGGGVSPPHTPSSFAPGCAKCIISKFVFEEETMHANWDWLILTAQCKSCGDWNLTYYNLAWRWTARWWCIKDWHWRTIWRGNGVGGGLTPLFTRGFTFLLRNSAGSLGWLESQLKTVSMTQDYSAKRNDGHKYTVNTEFFIWFCSQRC